MKRENKRTGTKEWSDHSKNCLNGCANGCLYCYATEMKLRFKQIRDRKERANVRVNFNSIGEHPRRLIGRIMFPSTHDLDEDKLPVIIAYLHRWLEVGNDFLIVTKPNLKTVKELCVELEKYKDQMIFRFTIGSIYDDALAFWEPNAPGFMERLHALKYAYDHGFSTSVSIEPFLDGNPAGVVAEVTDYVTDTIWIGKMNQVRERVINCNPQINWTQGEALERLNYVLENQTDQHIKSIYELLNKNPKVRFKDSIKEVLNLPEEDVG